MSAFLFKKSNEWWLLYSIGQNYFALNAIKKMWDFFRRNVSVQVYLAIRKFIKSQFNLFTPHLAICNFCKNTMFKNLQSKKIPSIKPCNSQFFRNLLCKKSMKHKLNKIWLKLTASQFAMTLANLQNHKFNHFCQATQFEICH